MRGHQAGDAALDRDGEWHQIAVPQRRRAGVHHRQGDVGVHRRPAVTGKMLGAGQSAGALAPFHPRADVSGHACGVRAKSPRLDDRVLREQVEIGHRGEHPIDSHGASFLGGYRTGPTDHRCVLQRRERRGRRKFSEAVDLLACPPLQVRSDQQRSRRPADQVCRETAHRLHGAAEQNEPADADVERIGDRRGLVTEARLGTPAQCGEDEPTGLGRHATQAGVMLPSTREPPAPVAAGTLPGCPCSVR